MTYEQVLNRVNELLEASEKKARSIREKAKYCYAFEILDNLKNRYNFADEKDEPYTLETYNFETLTKYMLNGADNWSHYSWSGCSLCYNSDLLERLFPPSQRDKAYRKHVLQHGEKTDVHLLDIQARCLTTAANLIRTKIIFVITKEATK